MMEFVQNVRLITIYNLQVQILFVNRIFALMNIMLIVLENVKNVVLPNVNNVLKPLKILIVLLV